MMSQLLQRTYISLPLCFAMLHVGPLHCLYLTCYHLHLILKVGGYIVSVGSRQADRYLVKYKDIQIVQLGFHW